MLCCTALMGMSPAESASARPGAVEVRGPKGALGQLPLQVMDDGAAYVAAERLAGLLKGAWVVKGKTGTLTVARRSARFSLDRSRLTLEGQPSRHGQPPRSAEALRQQLARQVVVRLVDPV